MPIQFVGGATNSRIGSAISNTTIALNSGLTGGIASAVSDGDLVIAVVATGSTADRTLSITDGTNNYTLIDSELYISDTYDVNLRVAYKFVSGDTSTTFGPSGSTSDALTCAVYVFRGVDPTTPLDVAAVPATGTNSGLPNPPSITPTTSGAFIVCIGASAHSSGIDTFTSSDLTAFQTIGGNDTNDSTLGIGHKNDWTSGAFNAAEFGATYGDSTSYSWAAMSIALRPFPPKILTADGGSYVTTGTAAATEFGYAVIAGTASYAISGTQAALEWSADYNTFQPDAYQSDAFQMVTGVELTVDGGSYAIAGTAASLERGREVAAGSGSYASTGTAANLEWNQEVTAGSGAYTVSGTDATLTLVVGTELPADGGSYAATGAAASLEWGREVAAGSGSYVATGTAASLEWGREVVAGSGSYAATGTAASLEWGREVAAGSGSYVVTGTAASLEWGREVAAGSGSYVATGTVANLEWGREVAAGSGSYAVTGTAAAFSRGRSMVAGSGSYVATGTAASLEWGREVVAGSGSYAATGTAASLEWGREVAAGSGSYAATGTAASFVSGREVVAGGGSYSLLGNASRLVMNIVPPGFQTDAFVYEAFQMERKSVTLANPVPGAYAITGTDATLDWSDEVLLAEAGGYDLNGTAADLYERWYTLAEGGVYAVSGATTSLRQPSRQGYIWVWDGTEWREKPMKVWNGAAWQAQQVKYCSNGWRLA